MSQVKINTFKRFLSVGAALGVLGAGPALADNHGDHGASVAVGQTLTSTLDGSEPTNADGRAHDTYRVTLEAGQLVEVRMQSDAFDTYLYFGRGHGDAFEIITSNDDSDGSLNSYFRSRIDESGEYVIHASAFGEGATGEYTLNVALGTPPLPISLDQPVTGRIEPIAEGAEGMQPMVEYGLQAEAGDLLMATLDSTEFDALLEIGIDSPWGYQPYAGDDDSGGDLNARALFVVPESGTQIIRAMAFDATVGGAYTLIVAPIPQPVNPPRPTTIRPGQSVDGEVMFGETVDANLRFYDSYALRGRAGETRTVRLTSDAFDAYLEVGAMTPAGWAVAQSNDDDGESLNSALTVTFENSGTLIIRAMALGQATEGAYTLSVE